MIPSRNEPALPSILSHFYPSNVTTCNITWIWKKITFVRIHANDFPQSSLSLSSYPFSFFFAPFPDSTNHHQLQQHSGLARGQGISQEVQNDRFQPHRYMQYGVWSVAWLRKFTSQYNMAVGSSSLKRCPRASLEELCCDGGGRWRPESDLLCRCQLEFAFASAWDTCSRFSFKMSDTQVHTSIRTISDILIPSAWQLSIGIGIIGPARRSVEHNLRACNTALVIHSSRPKTLRFGYFYTSRKCT